MAETKTKATGVSIKSFLSTVESEARRKDAETLVKLFEKATGWKARMWGPSIIGFGKYAYTYDSGHSGEMCVVGFSPRKANLVVYVEADSDLLKQLGKHKTSKACVYINKLADVDLAVLEKLIRASVVATRKNWPVSAS